MSETCPQGESQSDEEQEEICLDWIRSQRNEASSSMQPRAKDLNYFSASTLPEKINVFPSGDPEIGFVRTLVARFLSRSTTKKTQRFLEEKHLLAEDKLAVSGRTIMTRTDKDSSQFKGQRILILERQARIFVAQEEMQACKDRGDRHAAMQWRLRMFEEIKGYINMVEVTTRKVNYVYGTPPRPGEGGSDTYSIASSSQSGDDREATLRLLSNLVQTSAAVDSADKRRVRGWATKALRDAICTSISSISQWLGNEERLKNARVYWLWHAFPEKSERSRSDILYLVASHGKEAGSLCPAFFIPKNAIYDRSFSVMASFVPTIANELAGTLPYWKTYMDDVWATTGKEQILGRKIRTQFMKLIINTYRSLLPSDQEKPILIIIDCFDECSSEEMESIVEAIQYCIDQLPICFVISSKRTVSAKDAFDELNTRDYVMEAECTVRPDEEDEQAGEPKVDDGPETPRPAQVHFG
ncbi:hypothetical protein NMY22_g9907 [Coprinellus aureogranulatus]|nr:hypothetical protein NMY22_g9907 [Coprinellus aureogranulatus]